MAFDTRSAPLQPVSAKRARQQPERAAAERSLGRRGTQGTCRRCRQHGYVNGHERRSRAQGGDPTRPDCLLCIPCNTWCEDNPAAAAFTGWKVSRKHNRAPHLTEHQAIDIYGQIITFGGGFHGECVGVAG
jgi:hypothetical protein